MSDARQTQKQRLRALLESRAGQWVGLPEILDLHIAQFGARIKELRAEGMNIENETEHYCECGHAHREHSWQNRCSNTKYGVSCSCSRFRNATVRSRYRYLPPAQQKLFGDAA